MAITQKSKQSTVSTSSNTYKYSSGSVEKEQLTYHAKSKTSVQPDAVLGYDISLIKKDLVTTSVVTIGLVGVLIFLAWYLPIGILSS